MLLLERLFEPRPQRHDLAHVDLVEGRQHGGGVLRFLEAARDGLAQPRHAHALLALGVGGWRGRARLRGGWSGSRSRSSRGRCRGGRQSSGRRRRIGDDGQHVALQQLTANAGALNGGRVDAVRGGDLGRGGRWRHRRTRGRSGGFRRCGRGCGRGAGRGGRLTITLRRGRRRNRRSGREEQPTPTVSPSLAAISASTPDEGALTSRVTLSVSSSTSGSSALTASPVLNQRPIVASLTDSPRVGTRISIVISVTPRHAENDPARCVRKPRAPETYSENDSSGPACAVNCHRPHP